MTGVFPASSVKSSTLADGTLRVVIDFEPRYKNEVFRMLSDVGTPLAVARLVQEHERDPEPEIKGGALAKLAGMWVRDTFFIEWCKSMGHTDPDKFIKDTCAIDSKKMLDNEGWAAEVFHEAIRKPFAEWLKRNHKFSAQEEAS